MKHVVALLSGGLDSAVLLYRLLAEGHRVTALSVDYGQRHARELVAARAIADSQSVPLRVVQVPSIASLLVSSQTNSCDVPHGHYADESMRVTVVPNRNMIMLAIAAGVAWSMKAQAIAYAAHRGDHAIYPDCRPEFVRAMDLALDSAHYEPLDLLAPFLATTKGRIVEIGSELAVPFGLTYSCYEGAVLHCGKCGTCVERIEAFRNAGVPDPTEYV